MTRVAAVSPGEAGASAFAANKRLPIPAAVVQHAPVAGLVGPLFSTASAPLRSALSIPHQMAHSSAFPQLSVFADSSHAHHHHPSPFHPLAPLPYHLHSSSLPSLSLQHHPHPHPSPIPSTPSSSPRSLQRLARKAELARQSRKRKKSAVERMEGQIRKLKAEVARLRVRLGEGAVGREGGRGVRERVGSGSEESGEDEVGMEDGASATSTGSVGVSPSSSTSSLSSSALHASSGNPLSPHTPHAGRPHAP